MEINTDKRILTPRMGDILVLVRKNGSETPYLIISQGKDTKGVALANMHSGYVNYKAETIDEVVAQIVDYYKDSSFGKDSTNKIKVNPLKMYYFVKTGNAKLDAPDSFGHTVVNE